MRDWREYDKVLIFTGKDEDGNRYLSQFLKDYKNTFHPQEINAGCERCLNDYYKKTIKYLNMAPKKNENTDFILKLKYQGIPLKFGSKILVTNANLTDEIGAYLLENHPRGEMLFDAIGEVTPKEDKDLKLDELRKKYPEIKAKSKKDFLGKIAETKEGGE